MIGRSGPTLRLRAVPEDPPNSCPTCGRPLAAGASRCPSCTALAQTVVPSQPRDTQPLAGRYVPQRLLGRGGAKDVWLAHDLTLDRPVALSRLRGAAHDESARERVRREARLMARLGDHPRIVTVYDAIEQDGALVIVARFMAGGSLAERAAAAPERRLPVSEVLRAGEELADALEHAHDNAVVHRDVKPDNAWLAADGSAALGDFGIAVADAGPDAGGASGTPFYVAPEQASGRPTGPPADLYALGATLYELLCGRPPFTGAAAEAVIAQHLSAPPRPVSELVDGVPPALDELLLRLLAKEPADRPASAGEVRDALAGLRGAGAWAAAPRREPLVGRERELAVAADALRGARDGALRVVALSGEPGMGKTRLASEIEAGARTEGALAVWGRAIEDAGAFAPWVAVLRDLLPHAGDLPAGALEDVRRLTGEAGSGVEPVSSEDDRARIFDAVAAMLVRAAEPAGLVVVLDDLHWADRSSLELVRHVTRAAAPARLLLVLAYREADDEPGHPLPAVLEELGRARGFARIRLGGLALEEVRRFVPEDAGLGDTVVRDLHARTGGNPFFVAELARTAAERAGEGAATATAVPDSVRQVVLDRLRPLPADSRRALDAAAVLGRPFTVVTVGRIAGLERRAARTALEPARVARLVTEVPEAPGRLAFAHAIVRDAVRDALPPSRRGPLHAAVVDVLRAGAQRGAEVPIAEVAHHALVAAREGEDPQVAYELSLEAAHEAGAVLAHAEAAGHYGDALEALDELGAEAEPEERAAALEGLAAATVAAGEIGTARRHYRRAAADARRRGDAAALARAALGFAEFHRYGEIDHEAIKVLEQALEALPESDSPERARVAARLAVRLDPAAGTERREALVEEATAMARRLGGGDALTAALYASVLVNWRPQRSEARAAAAAEILALAPRARNDNAIVWARMARLVDGLELGRGAAVQAELTGLAAVERDSRRPYVEWCVALLRSTWATFTGRLAEGERLSEHAVALARAGAEDADQEYAVQRLVLAKLRGRPEDAGRAALATYAARYADLPVWTAMLAAAAWDLGRADEARQAIDAVERDGFAWLAATPDGLEGCALLAEAVAGLGRAADAERLYALLEPVADRNAVIDHGWAAIGPFARALAQLAAALGRADDGARPLPRRRRAVARLGRARLGAARDRRSARRGPRRRRARGAAYARSRAGGELELPSVADRLAAQKTTP